MLGASPLLSGRRTVFLTTCRHMMSLAKIVPLRHPSLASYFEYQAMNEGGWSLLLMTAERNFFHETTGKSYKPINVEVDTLKW